MCMAKNSLTYKEAGVDIEAGNEFVRRIKPIVKTTNRPGVLGGIGGFGGLFSIDKSKYKEPILVSGTDGVGTKLKIAFMMNKHDTIGIDLVAMCANDIIVSGAEPLFFLDYYAMGKLNLVNSEEIIKGIADGCKQAGCALLGGETAEMPGIYSKEDYDLAGFVVGIVDKEKIIDGKNIKIGDSVIGVASSGIHSNGYSLVRKIFFEKLKLKVTDHVPEFDCTVGEELLKPTKIYVKSALELIKNFEVKGIAHITGGGFTDNIPRVLPEGVSVKINKGSWPILPVFKFMQDKRDIAESEMFKTFNMGIGLVLVVNSSDKEKIVKKLESLGEKSYVIGEIVKGEKDVIYS